MAMLLRNLFTNGKAHAIRQLLETGLASILMIAVQHSHGELWIVLYIFFLVDVLAMFVYSGRTGEMSWHW